MDAKGSSEKARLSWNDDDYEESKDEVHVEMKVKMIFDS